MIQNHKFYWFQFGPFLFFNVQRKNTLCDRKFRFLVIFVYAIQCKACKDIEEVRMKNVWRRSGEMKATCTDSTARSSCVHTHKCNLVC